MYHITVKGYDLSLLDVGHYAWIYMAGKYRLLIDVFIVIFLIILDPTNMSRMQVLFSLDNVTQYQQD